jgi:hypothetical protein
LGGRAVGTDAVLDGNDAALVLAERRVNQSVVVADVAVDDGEVFLLDGAGFPDFAEFAGGFGIFGDDDDAAGFAVEAVDEMGGNGNHLARNKWRFPFNPHPTFGHHFSLPRAREFASGREGDIQIKAGATDQAGHFAGLGRVTNESGRFVDDQQVRVFVDDVEQVFQARGDDNHG